MHKCIFNQIPGDAFVERKEKAFSLYSWLHVLGSYFFFYALGESDTIYPTSSRIWHFATRVLLSLSVFLSQFCKLLRLPLRNYWSQLFWLSGKQSRNWRLRIYESHIYSNKGTVYLRSPRQDSDKQKNIEIEIEIWGSSQSATSVSYDKYLPLAADWLLKLLPYNLYKIWE